MGLIELYPEIAKYITDTGDLTLKNGIITEQVAARELAAVAAKKQAYEADLQAQIDANNAKIQNQREFEQGIRQGPAQGIPGVEIKELEAANEKLQESLQKSRAEAEAFATVKFSEPVKSLNDLTSAHVSEITGEDIDYDVAFSYDMSFARFDLIHSGFFIPIIRTSLTHFGST